MNTLRIGTIVACGRLQQPPLSIDALLDELNMDIGTAAMPVDREEFTAVLRTDRELRKSLID